MFMIVRKNNDEYFIECFDSFVKHHLVEYYQIENFAYGIDSDDFVWLIDYTGDNANVKRLSYTDSEEFLRVISGVPHSEKFDFGLFIKRMIKTHLIAEIL